jgi:hypothetical protein
VKTTNTIWDDDERQTAFIDELMSLLVRYEFTPSDAALFLRNEAYFLRRWDRPHVLISDPSRDAQPRLHLVKP